MFRRTILLHSFFLTIFTCFLCFVIAETASTASEAKNRDQGKQGAKSPFTKLLRYPDICGNAIVFCHGGDLWKVNAKGGTATRLTAHEGQEIFPKFSPDGKWIAFTGQYDGDEQVYVIPTTGGVPKQLTFYPAVGPLPPRHGYDNIVYGWTPDGKKVLFRSLRDSNSVTKLGGLYTVALDGGMPERLPMPTAGAGAFSPDGKKIVYSPLFRDFRSWKRYQGGWAQYLTIFDLETHQSKRLDKNVRTERDPMWIGGDIYFVSDRTGTMNLFRYEIATGRIAQCTHETEWDVRWPSADPKSGKIVYELAGELVVYEIQKEKNPNSDKVGKAVDQSAENGTEKAVIAEPANKVADQAPAKETENDSAENKDVKDVQDAPKGNKDDKSKEEKKDKAVKDKEAQKKVADKPAEKAAQKPAQKPAEKPVLSAKGVSVKLNIRVPHDGLAMRPARLNVSRSIESYYPSPGGKRAAVIARGDLFTVPTSKGFMRNLTGTSNAHERCPVWSKDGRTIAYISDVSGEDQLYLIDQSGEKPAVQLTKAFKGQLDALRMSPDGKFLSVSNCEAKLFVVATEDGSTYTKGEPVEVARATNGGRPFGAWSPCGGYLAYILYEPQGFGVLYVWERETRNTRRITDPMFDVESPAWDGNGEFLYYLSRREFAPQFSSVEWNFAGNRDVGIFALALRKDVKNPFAPQSDEVDVKPEPGKDAAKQAEPGKEPAQGQSPSGEIGTDKAAAEKAATAEKADGEKTAAKKPEAPKKTKIDWDGLARRVVRVPVAFENYENLEATSKFLVYVKRGASFYGRESYQRPSLSIYDVKERKEYTFGESVDGGYEISPDGAKLIYKTGGLLKIADLKPAPAATAIPTGDLALDRIPSQEWAEMFDETWRKFRDFFYVRNMHGYDWDAIGRQYRALLPHVAHRSDLNYVLSEMVSELNVGHAYIQGGDFVQPERPAVALPGCRFALEKETGLYRISKIYRGMNEEPKYRSPLTEIGVDANEGDYVLAVDGIRLKGNENPYRLLQHRKGLVTLTLNTKPTFKGARKTSYVPIASEKNLLYLDFVLDAMERVNKASDGRVGYIHIPDMGVNGSYEFLKWYYPQIRKEGLVIDDRSNGGGNISQWIIMRLNQQLLGTRFGGPKQSPGAYPGNARYGYQVCLISETSASDGDIFPHYFRKSGLGPLIGKRSWGGVVGISPRGQLLDGGLVYVPLQGTNDENGNWIIEGSGVQPDIEVENDPKAMLEGRDPQLERGIKEVLKLMDAKPKTWPKRPSDPVKTK